MHLDHSQKIILDIRVNHTKIGEFIKYQEQKFIKEREIEFREKKKEILLNTSISFQSPTKLGSPAYFRVQTGLNSTQGKGLLVGKQPPSNRIVSLCVLILIIVL